MNNQSDRDTIAEEAVGQRRDGAPSYAVKEEMSEEAVRRIAQSAGAAASIPRRPQNLLANGSGMRIRTLRAAHKRRPGSLVYTERQRLRFRAAQAIRFSRPVVRLLNSCQIASMNNHLRWRSRASPSAMRPQSCFTGEPTRMPERDRVRFKLRDLHGARDIREGSSSQLSSKP
jgi:hypothetical protein